MSQVASPPLCPYEHFHVQLHPIELGVVALLLKKPAAKLRLKLPSRELAQGLAQALELVQGCWCPARMLRGVPCEAMPELFDVRKRHRVKHALPSPIQSSWDIVFLFGSRKTLNSTDHPTEYFPMGGANCCMTFQTHEFLFLFPLGGSTIVAVSFLLSAWS